MRHALIPVPRFQQNGSLPVCPATKRAACVDPGAEVGRLPEVLAERGLPMERPRITHGYRAGGSAAAARCF